MEFSVVVLVLAASIGLSAAGAYATLSLVLLLMQPAPVVGSNDAVNTTPSFALLRAANHTT
jgi:hypothetical protein